MLVKSIVSVPWTLCGSLYDQLKSHQGYCTSIGKLVLTFLQDLHALVDVGCDSKRINSAAKVFGSPKMFTVQ